MNFIRATGALMAVTIVTAVSLLVPAAHAGILTVNTATDLDDGTDTFCSLREAMQAAFVSDDHNECEHLLGGTDPPHNIQFSGSFTITVGSTLAEVVNEVTVDGTGQSIVVDGGGSARPFNVDGGDLVLLFLTVENGSTPGAGGAVLVDGGSLAAIEVIFSGNSAGSGGAISSTGTLSLFDVQFVDNQATAGSGGAISFSGAAASMTIVGLMFSGNSATENGGAIFNNNTGANASEVANSIFADSAAGGNCGGEAIADLGGNVQFPDAVCGATIPVADPVLGPAMIHPGPNLLVWTMELQGGSAALGVGDPSICGAGPVIDLDARGLPRPAGDPDCDSGAYESDLQGGEAVLTFTPSSHDFGPVQVFDTATFDVILENTGAADAENLVLTGPAAPFSQTNDCPATLAPAATCTVTAEFAPTAAGTFSDSVDANADGGVGASLILSGEGAPAPGAAPTPEALDVDGTLIASDGNRVFEPGEQVEVAPAWRNNDTVALSLMGTASGFTGPAGASYVLVNDAADYGTLDPGAVASCLDTGVCYALEVDDPADRPVPHWDATFDETLDDAGATVKTWTLHIGDSFADVPRSHLFYRMVEVMVHHGMAMDCGGGNFCPDLPETREMMAMAVLRALEGNAYTPPPCDPGQQEFADVPAGDPFCPWVEELFHRGVIAGCGGGNYCPDDPVTRAQMAVFLLKSLEGSVYSPPPCGGVFEDVPCPSLFADWIEDLFGRGITAGCSASPPLYCPGGAITRGQCAVFQSKNFDLTLYGP